MVLPRALLAAAAAVLLASCAAGAGLFSATGHVQGHVMTRVCGGAYQQDQSPCRVAPVAGATLTFRLKGSSETDRATTDSAGAYAVDLKAGTYSVEVGTQPSGAGPLPGGRGFLGPKTITVTAGNTVTADFTRTIELL